MTDRSDPRLARYRAYAEAFESAYASDDWTLLTPHFTEDATAELNGTTVRGRDAILAAFRSAVSLFDRRFDSRRMRLVLGPEWDGDGRLHTKAIGHYERADLPALELHGEEWFSFADDRIHHHVDQVLNLPEVMQYLSQHITSLR